MAEPQALEAGAAARVLSGGVTISERNGMLKTYELMTRHFGWDKPPKPASVSETTAYLLDRALRAQGLVSLDSICHLDAPSKAAVRRLIEARVALRRWCRSRSRARASRSIRLARRHWSCTTWHHWPRAILVSSTFSRRSIP